MILKARVLIATLLITVVVSQTLVEQMIEFNEEIEQERLKEQERIKNMTDEERAQDEIEKKNAKEKYNNMTKEETENRRKEEYNKPEIQNIMPADPLYLKHYLDARCCQILYEHDEYIPVSAVNVASYLGILIKRLVPQVQISWSELGDTFFNPDVFFDKGTQVHEWTPRIGKFILCFWKKMDELIYGDQYNKYFELSRERINLHKKGWEIEQKIMTYAVMCYQMFGRKIDEPTNETQTSGNDIVNILSCFKNVSIKTGDAEIIKEYFKTFMKLNKENPMLKISNVFWDKISSFKMSLFPPYVPEEYFLFPMLCKMAKPFGGGN